VMNCYYISLGKLLLSKECKSVLGTVCVGFNNESTTANSNY